MYVNKTVHRRYIYIKYLLITYQICVNWKQKIPIKPVYISYNSVYFLLFFIRNIFTLTIK